MKRHLKKYLIPHEENDHQPHFLRKKSLLTVLSVVIGLEILTLALISPLAPLSIKNKFGNLSAIFSSVLVEKTNESRLDANKSELAINDRLVAAAQLKANDMASKGYFAHTSPEGLTPWYFLGQAGYSYSNAGENLAVNFVDSNDVHRAWLNSPTHKANILRDGFQEIGIATAEGKYKGKDAIFVAQYFGSPSFNSLQASAISSESVQETILKKEENNKVLGASTEVSKEENRVEIKTEQVLAVDLSGEVVNNSEEIKRELAQADTEISNPTTDDSELTAGSSNLTWFERLKTSPRFVSTVALLIAGLAVLIAVLLKIFIKPRIQYPPMIFNGLFLVLIIVIFALANDLVVGYFAEVL